MVPGGEVHFMYTLAARLGKSLGEVMDLPLEELRGWAAFMSAEHAANKGRYHGPS